RQVAAAPSHDRLEVGALEAFDGPLLGLGEGSREVERASFGFAAPKSVALARDVADADDAVFAEGGGAYEDVAELAHVAGERAAAELGEGDVVDDDELLVGFQRLTQEVARELGNVFDARAERRQDDADLGEPEVQVFSEVVRLDLEAQIAV